MPGSQTALGQTDTRNSVPAHLAFRQQNGVSAQDDVDFAAQWLAYAIPCRRFADILADACARLGADVVCYSFIVVDSHHLLLADLPAHSAIDPLQNSSSVGEAMHVRSVITAEEARAGASSQGRMHMRSKCRGTAQSPAIHVNGSLPRRDAPDVNRFMVNRSAPELFPARLILKKSFTRRERRSIAPLVGREQSLLIH
jgi:hypothetical protein